MWLHKVYEMTSSELEDLSDEIILKILSNVDKKDLIQCSQVSKRFRNISYDQSLWLKVDLRNQSMSAGFLNLVLSNGCKNLCLSEAKIEGTLSIKKMIALEYLDLSWTKINKEVLETLFASCFSLQELSMGSLTLSSKMISSICYQNGKSLRLLDFQYSWGLNPNLIQLIFENCTELNEVNLDKVPCLSKNSMDILVNNLTPKVEKLSLMWVHSVHDEHVTTLVQRCNKLLELNLQGTSITNTSINNIILHQKFNMEALNVSGCFKITFEKFFELKSMPRLRRLTCLGLRHGKEREILKKQLPNVIFPPPIKFNPTNVTI